MTGVDNVLPNATPKPPHLLTPMVPTGSPTPPTEDYSMLAKAVASLAEMQMTALRNQEASQRNQEAILASLTSMGVAASSSSSSSKDSHTKLLEALITITRETSQKITCPKPTIKADSAEGLGAQLADLKCYFNESKVTDSKTWFTLTRNCCQENALREMEYFIAHDFGGEDAYQALLIEKRLGCTKRSGNIQTFLIFQIFARFKKL